MRERLCSVVDAVDGTNDDDATSCVVLYVIYLLIYKEQVFTERLRT